MKQHAMNNLMKCLSMKPFRWNIKRREQLGTLIEREPSECYPGFMGHLRYLAARVLSYSDNARLVFVGRSPESLYDYLSGVLEGTRYEERLVHLNISNRYQSIQQMERSDPNGVRSLKEHFQEVMMSPKEILSSPYPTCLVDLVASGGTMEELFMFLNWWRQANNIEWRAFKKKLRMLGITWRKKTSPNTWRWHQHSEVLHRNGFRKVKNVSADWRLWDFLGNRQEKVTPPNSSRMWGLEEKCLPPRREENLKALTFAHELFQRGKEDREEFSKLLAKQPAMNSRWFRRMVLELRMTRRS